MRIVHSCLRYPPATGGVETYVRELVERTRNVPSYDREVPKSEVGDVRVLTSKMRTHGPISELEPELLLDDPPYVQRLHHAATPLISYPRLQALRYYLGHHKPDIVHGHAFWYETGDAAARYAKANKIPFVFNPYYYENDVRKKLLWQLYRSTVGRQTFAAADVVVVISPFEQQLIERVGLPVKRFELIPPGIDFSEFEREYSSPFAARGISGKILLTVSRIAIGKGLDDAISALPTITKQLPDAQLVIVGEDFGARQHLETLAQQLGIETHVHFPGKLSREELIGAYQHADLLVHPSHYEAFGIVLAESLAAQTPVVARSATAIPYVAPHKEAGLLFNSHEELAAHTLALLANESQRTELGRQGHEHVKQNFTWDLSVKKLTGLYEDLVSS